jgi:DNA replication and repair protein RecF
LVALHPRNDALRADVDKILRQRNALLRQTAGRLDEAAAFTLDVWDSKLAQAGEALATARVELVERLAPLLSSMYDALAREPTLVTIAYDAGWRHQGLAAALAGARKDDLRRGVSTVGPHRDEMVLTLGGAPARTHASQGEQRTLALSLRLAVHHVVTATAESPPVLLLDDVFSELDPERGRALVANLPAGQTVLTTAGGLPPDAHPDVVLRLRDGAVIAVGGALDGPSGSSADG